MTAALEGVRVVELAGWMAAPGAAAMMADLGADVIKVEPLHGDAMRGATRQPEGDGVPKSTPASSMTTAGNAASRLRSISPRVPTWYGDWPHGPTSSSATCCRAGR